MVFIRNILQVIRDGDLIGHLAKIVLIDDGFHLYKINDALEAILCTNGQLDGYCIGLQTLVHHLDDVEKVCTGYVHLVDISHARNIVLLSLAPDRLGLGLDAAAGSQDCNSTVKDAQGALNFHRKVHVTRRINDVDTMILPMAGRSSGRNRNAALLLLNHPVHGGSTIMNLTNLVGNTGVEEDTLSSGRLTGINVSHDTDITSFFKGKLSCCHCFISLLYIRYSPIAYQR